MNQSIHAIDQLLYVAGPIKSVVATTATLAHERIEVEDTAVALLEFESGAKGVIQGSTACWSKNGHAAEVQICGDSGSAFLADDKFRIWEFKEEGPEDEKIRAEQMIKATRLGKEPMIPVLSTSLATNVISKMSFRRFRKTGNLWSMPLKRVKQSP